jgi:hypothetical protein
MQHGEALERGEVTKDVAVLSVRRRFLIDLAWPMETTDLADMFGLPPTSEEVSAKEIAESHATIKRLIDTLPGEVVIGPATDMAKLIVSMQTTDEDTLVAWLLSYTLAVISMMAGLE